MRAKPKSGSFNRSAHKIGSLDNHENGFSRRIAANFKEKVLRVVSKIPRGKVLTYKKVAEFAGRPRAYRAVGNILNGNYDPKIPCHRVVRSDGKTGGYNRGVRRKSAMLNSEKPNR
jgi:O-6-methylguanine DNA methyltransferase